VVEFADIEATRNGLGSAGPLAQSVLSGNSMTAFQSLSSEAVKCLSTARPSRPVVGQMIFETDTKLSYFWDGSAWVNAASPPTGVAGGVLAGTYPNPTLAASIPQSPKFATTNASITVAETVSTGTASLNLTDNNTGIASEGFQALYNSSSGNSFLRSTYSGSTLFLGAGSSSAQQVSVLSDGRILGSHAWTAGPYRASFPSGVNQFTTVTVSVPFRSTVQFIGSASCYVNATGLGRFYIAVIGITGWNEASFYYHNTTFDHRTYPTGSFTITLSAGSYTIGGYFASGQLTDANDQLGIMAVGVAAA
jgi:hypothetical protein